MGCCCIRPVTSTESPAKPLATDPRNCSATEFALAATLLFVSASMVHAPVQAGPIHDAARAGDADEVERMIAAGVDVDEKDLSDKTPLHWGVDAGHMDVVQVLAAKGANADATDFAHWTPVMFAVLGQHEVILEFLIASEPLGNGVPSKVAGNEKGEAGPQGGGIDDQDDPEDGAKERSGRNGESRARDGGHDRSGVERHDAKHAPPKEVSAVDVTATTGFLEKRPGEQECAQYEEECDTRMTGGDEGQQGQGEPEAGRRDPACEAVARQFAIVSQQARLSVRVCAIRYRKGSLLELEKPPALQVVMFRRLCHVGRRRRFREGS